MAVRILQWRSSTWARWLGWTVLFGLAQAGVLTLLNQTDWPVPDQVAVGLLVGLIAFALLIGVRFGTWWWIAGPVVAYSVLAAIFMVWVVSGDQGKPAMEQGGGYALLIVIIGAVIVMAPCTLAALAGVEVAAIVRTHRTNRRRGKRTEGLQASLLPGRDGATARDVLVARSLAMTEATSPSDWEPGDAGLPGQNLQPNHLLTVPYPAPDAGARSE